MTAAPEGQPHSLTVGVQSRAKTPSGEARPVRNYVPESPFGFWFLGTQTWERRVVQATLDELAGLIQTPRTSYPVVVDAGCGQGKALCMLSERFNPRQMIGLDADLQGLACAREVALRNQLPVILVNGDCAMLPLPDSCADLLFCHQTFHHLVHQERSLKEFHRVLKPGGVLLFAESTRAYINTWIIRFLFRHPMEVQKSAPEYLQMLRQAGFAFSQENVSLPYLWWSRATWRGVLELLRLRRVPPPALRDETLVYVAAFKTG